MSIVNYFYLLTVSLLLLQSCANNTSNVSLKSQYKSLSCSQLLSDKKITNKKYEKYRKQYVDIKSMWDHGNNDYFNMHRKTDEWKKNYTNTKESLKAIKSAINSNNCNIYKTSYGKVSAKPITDRWSVEDKSDKKSENETLNNKFKYIDITGNWTGSWASTNGKNGGEASATFIQEQDGLVGLFTIKDSPCLKSGTLEGSVSNSYATMDITSGGHKIKLDAYDISNKSFKGSYITIEGKCKGSKGDIILTNK